MIKNTALALTLALTLLFALATTASWASPVQEITALLSECTFQLQAFESKLSRGLRRQLWEAHGNKQLTVFLLGSDRAFTTARGTPDQIRALLEDYRFREMKSGREELVWAGLRKWMPSKPAMPAAEAEEIRRMFRMSEYNTFVGVNGLSVVPGADGSWVLVVNVLSAKHIEGKPAHFQGLAIRYDIAQ